MVITSVCRLFSVNLPKLSLTFAFDRSKDKYAFEKCIRRENVNVQYFSVDAQAIQVVLSI
jgi:hypothetical protein